MSDGNKHRCRDLGPAKMQKAYNSVDSNRLGIGIVTLG